MNFVQLCEELIFEAELLEEALNALVSDPAIRELAQDMKEFATNFKTALKSVKSEEYDRVRQDQLAWRTKLKQAILKASARTTSKASKKPLKTTITWKELDDYITTLAGEDKVFYKPFRILHSSNFEESVRKEIRTP